jgi:hypothetical protein
MEPLGPDLIRSVLSRADLPIDTRLDLGLDPKKLNFKNFFQNFRNKLVYDKSTQTLWDFRPLPEFYMKRKNLKFSCFRSPDQLYVFNMGWEPYDMTIYGSFKFGPRTLSNHLVIRDEIKFVN